MQNLYVLPRTLPFEIVGFGPSGLVVDAVVELVVVLTLRLDFWLLPLLNFDLNPPARLISGDLAQGLSLS